MVKVWPCRSAEGSSIDPIGLLLSAEHESAPALRVWGDSPVLVRMVAKRFVPSLDRLAMKCYPYREVRPAFRARQYLFTYPNACTLSIDSAG